MEVKGYIIEPQADLRGANLNKADLRGADLREADLRGVNLQEADLRGADLREADLRGVNLKWVDLRRANLDRANLRRANLMWTDLKEASLRETDLRGVDLREANLSGADGLLSPSIWLGQFKSDNQGVIVYRAQTGVYAQPPGWVFEPGAMLIETLNRDPCTECGCGVSFATRTWIRKNYPNAKVWRCRIPYRWLPDVVVPYNTDGKARCAVLELLEIIEP